MSESALTETEDYSVYAIPTSHAASHQDGGEDEITVAALSGELADEQKSAWTKVSGKPSTFPPEAHHATHEVDGSDELDWDSLNTYPQLLKHDTFTLQTDVSITGLNGDDAAEWLFVLWLKIPTTTVDRPILLRFNEDGGQCYSHIRHWITIAGANPEHMFAEDRDRNSCLINYVGWASPGDTHCRCYLHPKSGEYRQLFGQAVTRRSNADNYGGLQATFNWWENSADNITSIQLNFSGAQGTGEYWLYKIR